MSPGLPMTWREFLNQYAETLGVALAFAFMGSALLLKVDNKPSPTPAQALTVILAGLLVASCATAFVHGYLGWNIFVAPFVGLVCGAVALPIFRTLIKASKRVEDRADDVADSALDRAGIKKEAP